MEIVWIFFLRCYQRTGGIVRTVEIFTIEFAITKMFRSEWFVLQLAHLRSRERWGKRLMKSSGFNSAGWCGRCAMSVSIRNAFLQGNTFETRTQLRTTKTCDNKNNKLCTFVVKIACFGRSRIVLLLCVRLERSSLSPTLPVRFCVWCPLQEKLQTTNMIGNLNCCCNIREVSKCETLSLICVNLQRSARHINGERFTRQTDNASWWVVGVCPPL